MYTYEWVPSLLTWNYHNIVHGLYPSAKKNLKREKKKSLYLKLSQHLSWAIPQCKKKFRKREKKKSLQYQVQIWVSHLSSCDPRVHVLATTHILSRHQASLQHWAKIQGHEYGPVRAAIVQPNSLTKRKWTENFYPWTLEKITLGKVWLRGLKFWKENRIIFIHTVATSLFHISMQTGSHTSPAQKT